MRQYSRTVSAAVRRLDPEETPRDARQGLPEDGEGTYVLCNLALEVRVAVVEVRERCTPCGVPSHFCDCNDLL